MNSNEKSVQYEIYAPGNNQKLDLSVCSKTKIDILYPIKLDFETEKLYHDLKSKGYDLFDKYSKFYNDICIPYKSSEGTDVILADRTNNFFAKHEIICQANCEFSSYNSANSLVSCKCNAIDKERIEAEEPKKVTYKNNLDSFVDILKYSNYKVLKCYNLVFRGVTFYKNLGSIFTMIYFICYIVFFGLFCYQGITQLKMDISRLFKKKHDIRNNRNKKEVKVNVITNNQLKELINSSNNKNNKKQSIKNMKETNVIYSRNNKNMEIKKFNNDNFITNNLKGEFPPKRKSELSNSQDKENNLGNNNIIIHNTKSKNKEISLTDKKSFTKEAFFIKENQNKTIELNDIKTKTKDELNTKLKDNILLTDYEINQLIYSQALKYDERNFLKIYFSHLKREHPIIFTFFIFKDYNLFYIKLSKFFFLITTVMSLDALFFSNDAMHNLYESSGSYDLGHHIVQMILTIIVYEPLQIFLNYLTLTDIDYYKIKRKKETITQKEVINVIKCVKIRIIGFYGFTFALFLFFWYLNAAFCAVYKYTQGIFIVDSILCFVFALIYPLVLYLIPTGFRKISFISKNMKIMGIIYRISQFIPVF